MDKLIIIKNTIVTAFGVIGTTIAHFLGGFDVALQVLVFFLVADYISGLVVAGIFKKSGKSESGALDSRAGWKGIVRKVFTLVLVAVGAQVDRIIGNGTVMRDFVVFTFVANEGLSLLENVGLMGIPLPPKLKDALEALKGKADKTDKTE